MKNTSTAVGLAAFLLAGCPSYSIMHTAKSLPQGETEFAIQPVAAGFVVADQDVGGMTAEGASAVGPGVEFQVRHGLSETTDFGIKYSTTNPLSITADFNIELVDGEGFAMSIDPTINPQYWSINDVSVFTFVLLAPLLFDVVSTESTALTLGLIPGFWYGNVSGTDTDGDSLTVDGTAFALGGSFGVKFKLGESFAMMPNASFLYWFPTEADSRNFFVYTVGLAFMF